MGSPSKDPAEDKLARSVMDALWRWEPIRARDLGTVQVIVQGSTAVLRGIVASDAHKYAASRLAEAVSGIGQVVNELVTDEELERHIAVALASDEVVRHLRIAVRAAMGTARLYGVVPTLEIADRARAVALTVPGLAGIESKLQVVRPGTPVILAWQQSVEGRPFPGVAPSDEPDEVPPPTEPERELPGATPRPAGMEGTA